mmetsp:Transcript_15331/g.36453  ORF Transcript_15331/g.36453 Transcript_15331/m.36453 type:complete len:214 (+) Transcript_15331:686-1327(+)
MMRSTPSSTSRMASGGILSDRISLRLSDLMPPTAALAASSTGAILESSSSTPPLRSVICTSSLPSFFWSISTSPLRSTARSMLFWICSMATSASSCFWVSSARCSVADLESLSTSEVASLSLSRPPRRCSTRSATLARCCSKSFRQMPRKLTYMRGVAPCGTCDSCSLTICLTSAGRSAAARCSSGTPAKTCSGSRSMLGTSQLPIHSMEQRM